MTTDTQEGEAVAHPLSCLPDCMMPDGADPCKGYQTLAKAFDRITEDRARFPDRPDDIGRMIEAHIGNLKAGKEAADEHARNAFAKMATLTRQLAEARAENIEARRELEEWKQGNRAHIAAENVANSRRKEAECQLAEAREALKPFAGAVFNDNGDMTVGSVSDSEAYIKAYFVCRRLSRT